MAMYYGNGHLHHVESNNGTSNKLDRLLNMVSQQSAKIENLKKLEEDNASTILRLTARLESIEKSLEKTRDGECGSIRSTHGTKIPRQLSVRLL